MLRARYRFYTVHEVGVESGNVLITHERIRWIRHGRIQGHALIVDPMADGTIEVVESEFSDPGFDVGRDVRAVNRAHGRIQRKAACERLAARLGVAGGAISGRRPG